MTTALQQHTPADGSAAPPRSRGRLVLEKRAVERIAAQAASESDSGRTGGVSGGFLGFGTHRDLSARPATTVDLVGQSAHVNVEVTVAYPTSIREATDAIRRHVMVRVHELTGVEVTRVDIKVTALRAVDATSAKEVR